MARLAPPRPRLRSLEQIFTPDRSGQLVLMLRDTEGVAPGAVDMVDFPAWQPVPASLEGRPVHVHNRLIASATSAPPLRRAIAQGMAERKVLPYLDIGRFYRHESPRPGSRRSLILVRDGGSRVGLIVDRLHGEHQTVIKPLGQVFQHIRGLAGSTILGSGEVALILDVPALLTLATSQRGRAAHATSPGNSPPAMASAQPAR